MANEQSLIVVEKLFHQYQPDGGEPVRALDGINLRVNQGEWLAIAGANGSGKTTLARHLNGLLLPGQGSVRVGGMDTQDPQNLRAIRSRVSMVFQRPEDQIVATTVEDDVAFGPLNLGLNGGQVQNRVRNALEVVNMWEHRRRPPHFLSAGQQQRVAIAGALAMKPQCLVLDEATAMLDPAGRSELLALIKTLQVEGLTVVWITHHMDEVSWANRVLVLQAGRVAFDGGPGRLFDDEDKVSKLGLESPSLVRLSNRLAQRWPDLKGAHSNGVLAKGLLNRLEKREPASESRPTLGQKPPTTDRSAVEVQDLCHTYLAGTPFATPSLVDVSLRIGQGEIVALAGATGSGKSTLLQQIAGLLQPDSGWIQVEPLPAGSKKGRLPVAMLFQRSEEQLFETFVGDDVAFGPRQLGLAAEVVRERVRNAMEAVGLSFEADKDRFTQGLSGGEQRKAALAGVLALDAPVLLLDEPTAGMDATTRKEVLETLRRINRDENVTLVIASHTMEEISTLAHRIVIMDKGRIVMEGSPRSVFSQTDRIAKFGLEVPPLTRMLQTLSNNGVPVRTDCLTVEETAAAIMALGNGRRDA